MKKQSKKKTARKSTKRSRTRSKRKNPHGFSIDKTYILIGDSDKKILATAFGRDNFGDKFEVIQSKYPYRDKILMETAIPDIKVIIFGDYS